MAKTVLIGFMAAPTFHPNHLKNQCLIFSVDLFGSFLSGHVLSGPSFGYALHVRPTFRPPHGQNRSNFAQILRSNDKSLASKDSEKTTDSRASPTSTFGQ